MRHPIVKSAEERMNKSIEKISEELKRIRTGRASPAILEEIKVDYYGAPTSINQLSTVKVEERSLIIQPWDKSMLSSIEKAIFASDIGLTPINDGNVIRLVFPTPTTEQRQKWVKKAKEIAEQGKIAIRNIRRDVLKELKQMEDSGKISEDDAKRLEKEIQDLTDKKIEEIEKLFEKKEKEIMEI
ncbi:ribosome recycling factor [Pseudothermotoga sp.]|uniref:ribosome recycling factor n=1 Tax=Pseudothermotoga sp. TaxID=2033661 RepID=UPI0029983139|nr:ribosome recycling factor [Pseudothermotoga sp.]MCX7812716.1 ribosome recycling factor [Pseudothermotoga sp.]MDW8138996.1 ribosome recycling factor [Pseudothermotoga sp.]